MNRSLGTLATFNPLSLRRPLAALLAVATLLVSLPSPAKAVAPGGAEEPRLFQNGERFYHLDLARLEQLWSVAANRSGDASLTLFVLRDAFEGAAAPETPLEIGLDDGLDGMVPLNGRERPDLISPEGNLTDPRAWEEVVTWNLSADDQGIVSTLVAGRDHVATRVPWALSGLRPASPTAAEPIEIEINGAAVLLPPELLLRLRYAVEAGEPIREESLPSELRFMAGSFDDLRGFMTRVHRIYLAEARLRSSSATYTLAGPIAPHGCTSICIGCVASVVLGLGAYVALIASCGGALVTGGATAIACIASFIGVQGTHFAVLASCGRCYDCAHGGAE